MVRTKGDKERQKERMEMLRTYFRENPTEQGHITVNRTVEILGISYAQARGFLQRSAFFEMTAAKGAFRLSDIPGIANSGRMTEPPRMETITPEVDAAAEEPPDLNEALLHAIAKARFEEIKSGRVETIGEKEGMKLLAEETKQEK